MQDLFPLLAMMFIAFVCYVHYASKFMVICLNSAAKLEPKLLNQLNLF